MYEILLEATGDRAEADDFDSALLAARTLLDDAVAAQPHRCKNRLRATLVVAHDGAYEGIATALAREGIFQPLSAGWSA